MRRRCLFFLFVAGALRGQDTWDKVERIVAVGDVHGGYVEFVGVLRNAKLIDEQDRWIGGRAHLVQTGDVLDRGPDSRKAMDLLMALEKRAKAAGGYVHALIGNHEAMNLYGDLRYTSAGEFASFRSNESEAQLAALWELETRKLRPKPDGIAHAKWLSEHPPGWAEHRIQFGPQGRYGRWIRSHNTVIRINGNLFLHGGISPKYASKSIREINEGVREELMDFSRMPADGYVRDEQGPLWYRGLAREDPAQGEFVPQMLKKYGARRMVIGHTTNAGRIVPLYGGVVLAIDVGLSGVYGGHRVCLILEGNDAFALSGEQKMALP